MKSRGSLAEAGGSEAGRSRYGGDWAAEIPRISRPHPRERGSASVEAKDEVGCLGEAALLVVPDPRRGDTRDARVGVPHRDAQPGVGDHLEIVEPVADRGRLGGVDPVLGAERLDRRPLVHVAGEGLEEMRLAADRCLRRERGPVLRIDVLAKLAVDRLDDVRQHAPECDGADAHRVRVVGMAVDARQAAVLDGQVPEPPLGRRVKGLVADHDVVDARSGVILQQMCEMPVALEHLRDAAHKLGIERAADDHRTIVRVVDERATRRDRVTLVIDVVEHMIALGQRPPGRGHDLDACVLQAADRLEIARAHLPLAVEQGAVEIGDEHSVAHGRENTLYPARVSTANATTPPPTPLYAAEGPIVVDACEAIRKGVLESQVEGGASAAPPSPRLAGVARALLAEANQKLLSRHHTEILLGGDGARAVALALATVRSGRSGVAVVPSGDLVFAVEALREARAQFRDPEHGLAVILEDDPEGEPMLCPRRIAIGAGLAVIEPPDLSSLRDAIEHALRLSRAGIAPVAIVVHASLFASIETIFARPNRIVSNVDELILQRRLRAGSRVADAGDLLRVARRLELNAIASLPSPGEREVVGFVAIGVCERALAHVLEELTLAGRVPVLRLGLVAPVDEAPLQRLLDRVQQVVVLEPRPGVAAAGVLATVESLRRRGVRIPSISCRELPPDREGVAPLLEPNDGCNPSILVRKTIHLLHAVRPSLAVATRLEGSDAALQSIVVPARDETIGAGAALRSVQQLLVELDQELRSRPEPVDGEPSAPRSLAIDALPPRSDSTGVVATEVFSRRRFLREGAEAIRQSARDAQQRLLIVVDVGAGIGTEADLLRVADAAIPASAASRMRAARVDVNDRTAVRERILEAVDSSTTRVLVLSDGPPARLDADAIERSFAERDRLGYQPQQRLVWNAEIACELRPPTLGGLLDEAEEQGSTPIQGSFTRENTGSRLDGAQFRAVTLSEQVEVVRTKPPITAFSRAPVGLAPPRAIHGEQGSFRVHLAGYRTATPGVVARILADAGRAMGYRVEVRASDEPAGRGRRAWAQVLFVRMRGEEPRAPRMGAIPYGEADLVIGIDGVETLRALGPDAELRVASSSRTTIVANRGPLEDQFRDSDLEACGKLELAAAECAQLAQSAIDDFASVCRTNLLSERLLDVALLGLAFQRGLVPVSLDAIEAAVRRAELQGTGRCAEAFHFGRRLAGEGIVRRSAEEGESRERLVRRLALELVRERFGGRRRAQRFALSAAGILAAFARFGESDEVDRAARAAVTALHRSIVWGGTRMMRQYESLLAGLLRADPSGDLALTAAEPLADALLVRDILYVLSMSTSLEQRRRIRERLGVRASHGDTLERRFLSRFELVVGTKRFRLDFRSSDWPSEVVRVVRPIVPWALRGEARAQEVRAYAISLAERASQGFASDPAHWAMCMRRFAMLASDGGLRALSAAELRASVEGL